MSDPMPDITPPQISEERIAEVLRPLYADSRSAAMGRLDDIATARAIIAERDRQWLERLELVGTTDIDGNLLTLKALPDGTPLYRIKEQG